MSTKLIGKKRGMTQIFDKDGNIVVCTVVEVMPNYVVQIKEKNKDGYSAIQMGAFKDTKANKPKKGHFEKAKIEPCKNLVESRIEDEKKYQLGQAIKVDYFSIGEMIDVIGIAKGRGFQGLMRLYGFAGMPASHGCSRSHRLGGSTGMRSTPGRCFPNGKRASRKSRNNITMQNLKVIDVDVDANVLLVKGCVPGMKNSLVYIAKAKKAVKKQPVKK